MNFTQWRELSWRLCVRFATRIVCFLSVWITIFFLLGCHFSDSFIILKLKLLTHWIQLWWSSTWYLENVERGQFRSKRWQSSRGLRFSLELLSVRLLREFDMVRSTSSRRVGSVRRVSRCVDKKFPKTVNNVQLCQCSERLKQALNSARWKRAEARKPEDQKCLCNSGKLAFSSLAS